jgi:polar amino acid transport system substrate-binding protein
MRQLIIIVLLTALPGIAQTSVAQTLARIQQSHTINIGFVPDQPPFSSQSERGNAEGYAVELCVYAAGVLKTRLGLPDLTANYIPAKPSAASAMLERGKIDVLCGAVTETLRSRELVSFSIPIYVTGVGALVRRDASPALLRVLNGEEHSTGPTWRATVNAGLANHVYVVHAGTTTEARVRERISSLGVIAKVVTVTTYEAGIQMVERRQADAFFADRAVLTTYAYRRKTGDKLLVLDRRFTLEPVALALKRGDEDFRLVVDTALSNLYRSGEYIPVYTRHFGEPTDTARMLFQAYALP